MHLLAYLPSPQPWICVSTRNMIVVTIDHVGGGEFCKDYGVHPSIPREGQRPHGPMRHVTLRIFDTLVGGGQLKMSVAEFSKQQRKTRRSLAYLALLKSQRATVYFYPAPYPKCHLRPPPSISSSDAARVWLMERC